MTGCLPHAPHWGSSPQPRHGWNSQEAIKEWAGKRHWTTAELPHYLKAKTHREKETLRARRKSQQEGGVLRHITVWGHRGSMSPAAQAAKSNRKGTCCHGGFMGRNASHSTWQSLPNTGRLGLGLGATPGCLRESCAICPVAAFQPSKGDEHRGSGCEGPL